LAESLWNPWGEPAARMLYFVSMRRMRINCFDIESPVLFTIIP
jgi:hypothetical protein